MPLSQTDKKILQALQNDCRISNQALASQVGMSASACWRRVRALEKEGIITRYAALVDRQKAGLNFHAIVLVTLARHSKETVSQFIEAIMERQEIIECLASTGATDYQLRVVCSDQQAFNHFMDSFLLLLPSVSGVHTRLVLKEIKPLLA